MKETASVLLNLFKRSPFSFINFVTRLNSEFIYHYFCYKSSIDMFFDIVDEIDLEGKRT